MKEAELERLERADKLEDAAKLALELGHAARASQLFERACDFAAAARAALSASDAARGFELSALCGDAVLEAQARPLLCDNRAAAELAAAKVEARGLHASAARLWLDLGEPQRAAQCFENAGELLPAAEAHRTAQDPKNAARCLEALLSASPERHGARLLLGDLLSEHGRARAAVRTLQQIPNGAPEYPAALALLVRGFSQLDMREAAADTAQTLEAMGASLAIQAPHQNETAELETVLFGRYRVVREVARTPTARVLEATDRITGARVALKIFAISTLRDSGRDALRRFEREAEVLACLRHPSILDLLAYLPDGPAVVLPWMAGGSLADLLARGPVAPARAAEITISVLSALGEAHRRGILHRDIKPANVLFDEAGGARLADFGTAHVADSAATVTAGVIGTLGYMAPEQRGGAPANVRSDIYGAGAVLVHTLTGAPPDAALPFLSRELGAEHQAVVERLTGDESQRPEDAAVAIALLRSVKWAAAIPAPRVEPPDAPLPVTPNLDERLRADAAGNTHDAVLQRRVRVLPAEAALFERALAFARADHPCLASVLSYQRAEHTLWIEEVPDAAQAPLSEAERAGLQQALEALHRAGAAHGAVNRAHLGCGGDLRILRFPLKPEHHDPAQDLADLAAL